MTRVYFVRHGTHALVGKALVGRMPGVSLSPEGRGEAERLAAFFRARDVAQILSSPLERCRETAAPVAACLGLGVTVAAELNEIDCGEWTGRDFASLADDPPWHAWNNAREQTRIPGGETMQDVRARVMALLRRLSLQRVGPMILISHSDVIKVVALTLLGAPIGFHDRLVVDPASVTTLDLWPDGGKVVRLNETVP